MRALIVALIVAVLAAMPLFAQHRPDCDSEEVTGDRFYDVCGSDRQTLVAYRTRVADAAKLKGDHAVEALRAVLCDVAAEDTAVQALVRQGIRFAATDVVTDEEALVSLVEADVLPFLEVHLPQPSERSVIRLRRVVADRNASTRSRCWALELLVDSHGSGVLAPLTGNRADPLQRCAARLSVQGLVDTIRHGILDNPIDPLYVESLLQEPVTAELVPLLCRLASNRTEDPGDRAQAIDRLGYAQSRESADCLVSLLEPMRSFVAGDANSVDQVLLTLWNIDRTRARKVAQQIDTSGITDAELRQQLEDTMFFVRMFDPALPYYDVTAPEAASSPPPSP
jgi:hypothetical protein